MSISFTGCQVPVLNIDQQIELKLTTAKQVCYVG